ncbi:LysE family translocator [Streptomyces sp. TS71-3]|uniref:LysE family translocator n=1 Tax=Streptomyces sp. TS71-3 TaxID=2733862 RepID=UPI001B150BA7|nr:LysE family translocator [Streptomyces sp. TS71-3]GHJ35320.1 hypothetical protein Sm713_09290 [Streptomyces sp. TS71-3]
MLTAALAFAGVAALINVTPGLDTLLVLRTAVAHGRTAGLAAALGILLGCLAWGVAAAVGLTAVLTASHLAYDILRVAGAAYLAWLGVTTLLRARRKDGATAPAPPEDPAAPSAERVPHGPDDAHGPHTSPPAPEATTAPGDVTSTRGAPPEPGGTRAAPAPADATPTPAVPPGRVAALRAGLGTNLLNPKAGVFYMSLVPQFIPGATSVFGGTMLLTGIDVAELALWYWIVCGAAAFAERIRRPAFRRRTEQFTGIAFLGFAANLLTEKA